MTQEEFFAIIRDCTQFLGNHYPRTPRERLLDIVESPNSEIRPDLYGNGGFLAEFEKEIAELLGKEEAVFMPSGTMAQQIALRIWADRAKNSTVAFHPTCHLEKHEQGAYRELHHLEAVLLGEPDRLFTLEDLMSVDRPLSSLLIELPQREIGGQLPTWEELGAIAEYAKSKGTKLHMDGARLWECAPFYQKSYREIADPFDSVYVSFYKVLSGLPGAMLAGPSDFIAEAKIWQRRHGGNLFNLFPNAISAKVGLDRHLPKIAEYVAKAAEVASVLNGLNGVTVIPEHPPTNMMHVYFDVSKEPLMDAVGEIAKREKCLLFSWATETDRGAKVELWIGEAGLDLEAQTIERLFEELLAIA